jgi:hypothetical protein
MARHYVVDELLLTTCPPHSTADCLTLGDVCWTRWTRSTVCGS